MRKTLSRARARVSGRYALACAAGVVLGAPALAIGQASGVLGGGERNPPGGQAFARETEIIADNATYATRQSNLNERDGGGAIYGCRSNRANEPCVRANNLSDGRAFEFETNGGEAGSIEVGDTSAAPFTTNAQGTVRNLSADKVDGRDGSELAAANELLWAAVGTGGELGPNRNATAASASGSTYTVRFNRAVSECSYTATPTTTPGVADLAVQAGNDPQTAIVRATAPTGFHLQVIC